MAFQQVEEAVKKAGLLRFLFSCVNGWIWIFTPVYFLSTGYSLAETGALVAAFTIATIFSLAPSGLLTDFKSPKKIAVAGLLLLAASFALLPAAASTKNFWLLLALMFFWGTASSLADRATASLAFKKIPGAGTGAGKGGRTGENVGFLSFATSGGMAVSLLLAGTVFSLFGFGKGFLFFAAAAVALAVYALRVQDARASVFEKSYWKVFRSKQVIVLFAVMFLLSYHYGVENTVMSVYSKQAIGLSDEAIGWLFAANIAFYAAFNYFAGRYFDSGKNLRKLFLAGLLVSAVGFGVYGATHDFQGALATRVFHDAGDAFVITYALYSLSRVGGARKVGGLQGVYAMLTAVGSAAGAFASGFVAAQFGLSACFVASALFTLAGGALLLLVNSGKLFEAQAA